jgi:uncharacterized membrane protein
MADPAVQGDRSSPSPRVEKSVGHRLRQALSFFAPKRAAQAVRSTVLLGTVGASLVLFVHNLAQRGARLDAFLAHNDLDLGVRNRLVGAIGTAWTLCFLASWGFLLWRRTESALDAVRRLALLLCPLALLPIVSLLFRVHLWEDDPLLLGCAIALVVLLLEPVTRSWLDAMPERAWVWIRARSAAIPAATWGALRHVPLALVVAGFLGYGLLVSVLTIRYHDRLGTAAFDLGGYDNIFYNALKGRPLRGTIAVPEGGNWSNLRVHAEFSTFAFLPFYALAPRAETLLCLQAFVVGLGALPVYLFAARRLSRVEACLLAAAYLLFAPAHAGNFYDFHFQPLGATLILWCLYFLDTRKNVPFVILFLIALGCREDVSMSFAVVGALMLASGYRPAAGLAVTLVSGVYFVVMRFLVMPRFGSWGFAGMYKALLPAGDDSLLGAFKTVLSNPVYTLGTLLTKEKFFHVLAVFLPVAFLPLRRPALWILFAPAVFLTVLTTGYHPTTDTTFQYVFYWVPFLFTGSAWVLERISVERGARFRVAAVSAMVLGTLLTSAHWGVVFQRATFASAWGRINLEPLTDAERQTLADLRALGAMVPQDASVAAGETDLPHVSNRLTAYTLRIDPSDADYVIFRPDSREFGAVRASAEWREGKFERVATRGKYVLLKKAGLP